MDIRIKTTDYELTAETSAYLDERLAPIEKAVEKDEAARCEVELGRHTGHSKQSEDHWFAELNVITKGNRFRSTAHAASINAAIDEVKDEILHTLRKEKRLHHRLWRKGGALIKNALRMN